MADRYWVGGTASWDGTAGTKWALTSGGAGGQTVPTTADDVFFDAASGVVTVTIVSGNTGAKSINCTGFTGTLAINAAITVSGSITLVTAMNLTAFGSGIITFNSNATITSAGKQFPQIVIDGVGITVQLGDALLSSSAVNHTVTRGTFSTNNFSYTTGSLSSINTNARTINLGSSTVTLGGSSTIDILATNLTFNAGTSQINCTSTTPTLNGASQTFYNVAFTDTSSNTTTITGANTFNNLNVAAPSSAGVRQVTFNSRQTINGTLSTTGTAGNRRVWFRSSTYGIAQTLTVNSTPSLTDADFRDLYVIGTAAPVSGTRIGNLRGCSGITFSTPKTVYWNLGGTSATLVANAWAATSGGTVSTNNFPLAQDTAVFNNSSTVPTGNIITSGLIPYTGTIDMSSRTTAIRFQTAATPFEIYGNWISGSGTTISDTGTLTFSGRTTQTITSAGKAFSGGLIVDTYGGSVELADALNIVGSNNLTVTNGTFDTKSYAVTAGQLSSNNTNIRTINLGSSTLTLNSNSIVVLFGSPNLLTFNAGTSQINSSISSAVTFQSGGNTFYNVSFNLTSAGGTHSISGENTFNNLSITAPSAAGLTQLSFSANQIISGTLTVAGAAPTRRIFVRSDTLGTPRTLTVGTLAATDCDFRDITITGAAANSTPTRAGNCGGNSGITFPAAKTVYWNLAGTQNWSATAWADVSGGTPGVNNFPLAQDVAVFDNAGAAGTVTINAAWNIGGFDASARTSAMTMLAAADYSVYNNWLYGTGITHTATGYSALFSKVGTQTITSNGIVFADRVVANRPFSILTIADSLVINASYVLQITANATFDAGIYNVTAGGFTVQQGTVKMGSGTWTATGSSNIWLASSSLVLYKGTANIVLSNTSTAARTFSGGGLSYNKLTIGGTTGISTTTISGNNQFTELASTKTVAHTIDFGSTTQTFGKWTISGSLGNAVTVNGSGTSHVIAGARVSGIDYVNMYIGFSIASPGEFYAGANSVGTGTRVINTAAPAPTTRYWVSGTGNWDNASTTRWSATSGGSGGASAPTSADDVIFDAASSAGSYTVTITATTGARCNSLTFAAPASGSVTWAGTAALYIHGNVTLPATGLTRTYTGEITLSGSTTGKTFTTNGVQLASPLVINGVGSYWTLGSSFIAPGNSFGVTATNGTFDTAGFTFNGAYIDLSSARNGSYYLRNSTVTLANSNPFNLGNGSRTVTFDAGTSSINCSSMSSTLASGFTFYNVSFNTGTGTGGTISGSNTYNNFTITARASAGIHIFSLTDNSTINGILTLTAGPDATSRTMLQSNVIGTTRTLTCASVATIADIDFRDIVIAGAAAPVSGTRLGDCKGNSGVTFDAPKTVYWNLAGSNNWSATAWATTAGATPAANNFPLAQDTAVFTATSPASAATTTVNAAYNIGTIDMSARTANTMTLSVSSNCSVYGNWINGTGTSLTGSASLTFSGRTTQTVTSSGKAFAQFFVVDSPNGSLVLQDAWTVSSGGAAAALTVTSGTFNANNYNVTFSANLTQGGVSSSNTNARTIAVGTGTWTISNSGGWLTSPSTNLTVTGTGTISLTSASSKTFLSGGVSYAGITLNQGGVGTLTINGNNTFADITNTYSATGATTIALGTTTQRVGKFSASGAASKVLTVTGTNATLVYTGAGEATAATTDYLNVIGVRAYNLADTWKAGANSINGGSLGWIFAAGTVVAAVASTFFLMF